MSRSGRREKERENVCDPDDKVKTERKRERERNIFNSERDQKVRIGDNKKRGLNRK